MRVSAVGIEISSKAHFYNDRLTADIGADVGVVGLTAGVGFVWWLLHRRTAAANATDR